MLKVSKVRLERGFATPTRSRFLRLQGFPKGRIRATEVRLKASRVRKLRKARGRVPLAVEDSLLGLIHARTNRNSQSAFVMARR